MSVPIQFQMSQAEIPKQRANCRVIIVQDQGSSGRRLYQGSQQMLGSWKTPTICGPEYYWSLWSFFACDSLPKVPLHDILLYLDLVSVQTRSMITYTKGHTDNMDKV